jgi:hypothetical protein
MASNSEFRFFLHSSSSFEGISAPNARDQRLKAARLARKYRVRKSVESPARLSLIVFMKKLRSRAFPLPGRAKGDISGTGFDIKFFPPSETGREAFTDPTSLPPNGNFLQWVDYFVNLVGAKVEKLNGFQFNLDDVNAGNEQNMSDELGKLADALKLGSGKSPKELRWPLAGSYTFSWSPQDAQSIGFQEVTVDLFFEAERDFRMVVNCSVELRIKVGNVAPLSSSSSYLATSSSG